MLTLAKLGGVVVAIAVITGCSAKSNGYVLEKPYLEMTEAEQQVALDKLTAQSMQMVEKVSKKQGVNFQLLEYNGDAKKDMIYSVAKYPQKVSPKQLKQMKKILAQSQGQMDVCSKPEAVALNQMGIGMQVRMVDMAGTELYKSKVCKGVKASPKLRGVSAAR